MGRTSRVLRPRGLETCDHGREGVEVSTRDIRELTTVVVPAADAGPARPSTSPSSTHDCPPRRIDPSIGPGDVLGRYRIEERMGEGGMGVVFRAFDPQLERDVALKILRPMGDEDVLGHVTEAALREARALAKLSHPNVVEIFDVGPERSFAAPRASVASYHRPDALATP